MNFSDFAKMLYPHIGKGQEIPAYVLSLIDMVMEDPSDKVDITASENDTYNPLSSLSTNLLNKIYNGERNISKKNASIVCNHFSKTKLVDVIHALPFDAQTQLCTSLAEKGVVATEDTVDERCAEICSQILHSLAAGVASVKMIPNAKVDEAGEKLKGVPVTTAYIQDGKVHIDGITIELPKQLQPPTDIAPHELPYIEQLLRAYADALNRNSIASSEVDTLPKRYRIDFADQRKAYYSADNAHHSAREIFENGESMFQDLKDDAYEGIKPTYWKDYDHGYARLIAVLEKITDTTLDKSDLSKVRGLISNLEKKGICQILVNDGTIESWVIDDDEAV